MPVTRVSLARRSTSSNDVTPQTPQLEPAEKRRSGGRRAIRAADRSRNPLLVYAALEAGIGLYALLIPTGFALLRPAYVGLHHLDLPYGVFSAGRALLAALVLLLPTVLMGGTFPLLVRAWALRGADIGRGIGVLYAVNTAGAIAGCLLAATGAFLVAKYAPSNTGAPAKPVAATSTPANSPIH